MYNANVDQISFIINLMQGYNKKNLFGKEIHKTKSIFSKNEALNKTNEILYNWKKIQEEG